MKNKHLTLDDRYEIRNGLEERLSFKAIGSKLGKDCTTISKEIKNHIIFEKKGAPYRPFNNCTKRTHCSHSHDLCTGCTIRKKNCSSCSKCFEKCPDFIEETCSLLSKAPYVCNGCPNRRTCTLEKHLYDPRMAQTEYQNDLSESRSGVNLTEEELAQLNKVVSPLLKNGQSIHHIVVNNADSISCCDKTLYSYTNMGLFDAINLDMPRRVRFRPRKNKSVPLKVDKACRIGRTYDDFKNFITEHPELPVVELDSVEGIKGGPVLLTVYFRRTNLQLAFLREANDSKSVTDIFKQLYQLLGYERYTRLFPLLLADNGSEFSNPTALEVNEENERIADVFYCDPSAPGQKGGCEVNHEFIRRIIPKGVDLAKYDQSQIRLMMDHINSYSRLELGDKSPYEMFEFYYGKEILDILGVNKIAANDIVLKPSLLK